MARRILSIRALVATGLALVAICSGVASADRPHHVCLQSGSTFYDITTDDSGTTMKRWNTGVSPAALLDTNGYATLHQPASASDMWGEGVAFAATMQTRSAWLNSEPNAAAYWDVSTSDSDTWRFQSTAAGGAAVQFIFTTAQCSPPPPSPTHVCLQQGSTYFDIKTDASATTMDRWNMATNPPTFIDRNGFAALHRPAAPSDMWGEGVAFAAAMQTRSAWVNSDPNPTAFWDAPTAGSDTWRFQSTASGANVEFAFRSSQCLGLVAPPLPPSGGAPTTLAPPPVTSSAPSGTTYRVCLNGLTYYDIRTSATETTMDRWNMVANPPAFMGRDTFAALHQPGTPSSLWSEGVDFAAAMQTRHTWASDLPVSGAYWDAPSGGSEKWRFQMTASSGEVQELTFTTSACQNL